MEQPVVQVRCGTCSRNINVTAPVLVRLLDSPKFKCPHCAAEQLLNLPPALAASFRTKMAAKAAAQRGFLPPPTMATCRSAQLGALESGMASAGLPAGLAATGMAAGTALAPSVMPSRSMGVRQVPGFAVTYAPAHRPSQPMTLSAPVQSGLPFGAFPQPVSPLHLTSLRSPLQSEAPGPSAVTTGDVPIKKRKQSASALPQAWQSDQLFKRPNAIASPMAVSVGAPINGIELAPQNPGEEDEEGHGGEGGDTFMEYHPAKLRLGVPHPDQVVETAALAAVEPPDVTYDLHIRDVVEQGALSCLQLESIVYASQRHQQQLPGGCRAGFFIGDGAGVGKGRTIAGLIAENWRAGRRRHVWVSVGSDLKFDARRDLDDVGASEVTLHPLNKLPYGHLDAGKSRVGEGVLFLTYSSLTASSEKGQSRLKQVVEWCGADYEGLIVFDECHKAKNLVPEAGSKPTLAGSKVAELQAALPQARVVYCSATGASAPRNLAYMSRLGLWGAGTPFPAFTHFLSAVQGKGVGALELVAMDMKARGMYVCRTLSFAGAEFEVVQVALEEPVRSQYAAAAQRWSQLRREFLYAEEKYTKATADGSPLPADKPGAGSGSGSKRNGSILWRSFWAAHQRFFRHMCMAAKVPALVRMAKAAVAAGSCVVIGLQSTGEARTAGVVEQLGAELDDFVSGPKELLLKLVDELYPMPPDPNEDLIKELEALAAAKGDKEGSAAQGGKGGKEGAEGQGMTPPTPAVGGKKQGRQQHRDVNYKEDSGSASGGASSAGEGTVSVASSARQGQEGASSEDESVVDSGAEAGEEAAAGGSKAPGSKAPSCATASDAAESEYAAGMSMLRREQAEARYSEARKRKEQVHKAVAAMALPSNPLDQLIDLLGGTGAVAEMTGRKGRLVRSKAGPGVTYEARNAAVGATSLELINVHERGLFMKGDKLIAIISEAASAGISLHADRRAANQRRRVHLTLELPWSADKAIQQFGRSHRANQVSSPQYRLLFTPLGGERRFAAAVARRLESLGALTQGDRRAGPSLADFNYESAWGSRALRDMYAFVLQEAASPVLPAPCRPGANGEPAKMSPDTFFGRARAQLLTCGIIRTTHSAVKVNHFLSLAGGAPPGCGKVADADRGDVARFLNRLLGLEPQAQIDIFGFFSAVLEHTVQRAKREGSYDDGITDVRGTAVTIQGQPEVVRVDQGSGAATWLYRVEVDRGITWQAATEQLAAAQAGAGEGGAGLSVGSSSGSSVQAEEQAATAHTGFYKTMNEGIGGRHHVLLALTKPQSTPPAFTILRPATGQLPRELKLNELLARYVRITTEEAQPMWEHAYTASGPQAGGGAAGFGARTRTLHLLTGQVLPVWQCVETALAKQPRAMDRRLQVLRLQTTGEGSVRLVGVLLPEAAVAEVVAELRSRLGREVAPAGTSDNNIGPRQ